MSFMLSDVDEPKLVKSAQKGDTRAFDELVKIFLPLVYSFAFRLVHDQSLAEDLAQDTFLKAWKRIVTFDNSRSFKPWLLKITRNLAYDFLRKKRVTVFSSLNENEQVYLNNLVAEVLTPEEEVKSGETKQEVLDTLSQMKKEQREVLLMHYVEELSASEISEILEEPLETIRTRLRRARFSFKNIFNFESEPVSDPLPVLDSIHEKEPKSINSLDIQPHNT